jgi:hypothetical protein
MNLDIPVFDTKGLKRYFYYFFTVNIIIVATSILLTALSYSSISHSVINRVNNWILFLILFAGAYIFSARSKKELKSINATEDFVQKFAMYEKYYKKKLIWNSFSLATSSIFFLLTNKNYFFYILIIQLVLSLVFYPSKKLLSKELQNNDIVFT